MSNVINCNRSTCVNNVTGVCGLESPTIIQKEAFNDCLDHKNKQL